MLIKYSGWCQNVTRFPPYSESNITIIQYIGKISLNCRDCVCMNVCISIMYPRTQAVYQRLKLTKMRQIFQVMKAATTLRLLVQMQNTMIKNPSLLNPAVSTPFLALSFNS